MHFTGDAGRQVGQQIEAGAADLRNADVLAQRRVQLVPLEDMAEIADAGGGQRLDRPGRDRVHADVLVAEIGGEVAHARFQCRLGDAHDVVVRSEEHTSELQSLMRISYAVFCLKKKNYTTQL